MSASPTFSKDGASPSSCSRRSTPSPVQLTPRSKVRAMLAGLAEDDSEVKDSSSKEIGGSSPTASNSTALPVSRSTVKSQKRDAAAESSNTNSEDDDVVARPKGRLAKRMQADQQVAHDSGAYEESRAGETAYQRVRRKLLQEKNDSAKASEKSQVAQSSDRSVQNRGSPSSLAQVGLTQVLTEHNSSFTPQQSPQSSPTTILQRTKDTNHGSTPSPTQESDSDSDLPNDPNASARFLALVARKRQEREAKEAEAARKQRERETRLQELAEPTSGRNGDDDAPNPRDEINLTQAARPTRKASKKALEDMARETQRLARNMHLAHEARTKKKITKQSLFERFNYKPAGYLPTQEPSGGSAQVSEADAGQIGAASSPAVYERFSHTPERAVEAERDPALEGSFNNNRLFENEELPSLDRVMAEESTSSVKSMLKKPSSEQHSDDVHLDNNEKLIGLVKQANQQPKEKKIKSQLLHTLKQHALPNHSSDSESDIEIVPAISKNNPKALLERFHHTKKAESQPLHTLLTLAQLNQLSETQPAKAKNSITRAELDATLQRRARQQATQALEERVQEMKDRGIIVQTAEERAKEEATIEDLFERAKQEVAELSKREKEAAKKEGIAVELLDNSDDESEDEDYRGDEEDEVLELSGSEEEEGGGDAEFEENEAEDDNGIEDEQTIPDEPLVPSTMEQATDQASVNDVEAGNMKNAAGEATEAEDDEAEPIWQPMRRNRRKAVRTLSDDEDEDEDEEQRSEATQIVPQTPFSAKKPVIPGLPPIGNPALGLTQLFACTMADGMVSQPPGPSQEAGEAQGPLDMLRQLPAASLPELELASPAQSNSQEEPILDSQRPGNQAVTPTPRSRLSYHQSQYPVSPTQVSELPDPTQDAGFAKADPILERFIHESPASTVATVLIDRTSSPIKKRKGRLQRRIDKAAFSDEDDVHSQQGDDEEEEGGFEISANAFDVLRTGSKRLSKAEQGALFDKNSSNAREMVEDQAEESEDEYAGLGGASDDENVDEEAELEAMKDMLDDETEDVDESAIAAFYADRDRAADSKQLEKLFKDVTTGMLRRKRGAGQLDLSDDSDYDAEARQRTKRRREAKLRKSLLADENVGKIATNPKKSAFLRSIEDHDGDGEADFLASLDDVEEVRDSQPGETAPTTHAAASAAGSSKSKKRSVADMAGPGPNDENRPPPHLRRTGRAKKPSTLSELRASLSDLIAAPNEILPVLDEDEDGDEEWNLSDGQAQDVFGEEEADLAKKIRTIDPFKHPLPRRASATTTKVVDRLSLMARHNTTGTSTSASTRLAFHAPSVSDSAGPPGFKPPSLLRRATTSFLSASASTSSTSFGRDSRLVALATAAGTATSATTTIKAKKGGGSIHGFVRAEERRKALERREKEREEERRKVRGGVWKGGALSRLGGLGASRVGSRA